MPQPRFKRSKMPFDALFFVATSILCFSAWVDVVYSQAATTSSASTTTPVTTTTRASTSTLGGTSPSLASTTTPASFTTIKPSTAIVGSTGPTTTGTTAVSGASTAPGGTASTTAGGTTPTGGTTTTRASTAAGGTGSTAPGGTVTTTTGGTGSTAPGGTVTTTAGGTAPTGGTTTTKASTAAGGTGPTTTGGTGPTTTGGTGPTATGGTGPTTTGGTGPTTTRGTGPTTTGGTGPTTTGGTGSTAAGGTGSTTAGTTASTTTTTAPAPSGTTCPPLPTSVASGVTLKYSTATAAAYAVGTQADYVCPCLQVWTTASGGNGARTVSATCTSTGAWDNKYAATQVCGGSSPTIKTSSNRTFSVYLEPATTNWTSILEASDACNKADSTSAAALGLSSADIAEINAALQWSKYDCPAMTSLIYAPSTMVGARVPKDLSAGCREMYRDTDGVVKIRDRSCLIGPTEKIAVVCESKLANMGCMDSTPAPGFYMSEKERKMAVDGSPSYGDTITFACDKCIMSFLNFPTLSSLTSKCFGPLGWFPYKRLISDCSLPCVGTIPEITSSTPSCSGNASTGVTMTLTCPTDKYFGGTNENSFNVSCQNVTVNGTTTTQLVATKNGTTFKTCESRCPLPPFKIQNAYYDWDGVVRTANAKVTYYCNSSYAFLKSGKPYLKPVTSTCLASSLTWTVPEQLCQPACTDSPPNVTFTTNDFAGDRFINSSIYYTCLPGYTFNVSDPLDVDREIMCTANRTWEKWNANDKCVAQQPTKGVSGTNDGECAQVTWKNTIGLVQSHQLPFFILGAENRHKVCRGWSKWEEAPGWLPGFQYVYTDQSTGDSTSFCAISYPHPNSTGSQYRYDPDFQFIVDEFEIVLTWQKVIFGGRNRTTLPKCALPVADKPAVGANGSSVVVYIGRKMICNDQFENCAKIVGGVTLDYGFRPAQAHSMAGFYSVDTTDFEVLVAKKKKKENPLRQLWSIALPAAAIVGLSIFLCLLFMHEKSPCCRGGGGPQKGKP